MYLSRSPSPFGHSNSSLVLPDPASDIFDDDRPKDPKGLENWSSFIGIVTAIVGNVLIALALNVQRYAHVRLHRERLRVRERAKQALRNAKNGNGQGGVYGSLDVSRNGVVCQDGSHDDADEVEASESDPLTQSFQSDNSACSGCADDDHKVASTYLKSPLWWTGQILITIGEMGNFLAYGFAPASIVSPLGVVALISNCVIAPMIFKEKFRKRDFWGVVIAVGGAVTVVLSAKTQETKLNPHDVWDAITTLPFEIYMGVTGFLIVILMWLSPKYGNRTILIDLGLVGLFGGYTALSTKGVSSMLSSTLFGAFTTPVTYVLIFILLGTAVMQIRYVNKALQRFDSTQVIPIQFVSFTLCVIIGSAVLYRDFERTTAQQAVKFVGGCLLTFFGVFLVTSGRPPTDEDEDVLSDEEGVEETIGLSEHDPNAAATPGRQGRRSSETTSSRRSSRVSFMDVVNKPLTALADTGVPSLRMPTALVTSKPAPADASESAPLLKTPPSRDLTGTSPVHPGLRRNMLSSDSAATTSSTTPVYSEPTTHPGTPSNQDFPVINVPGDSPVTPRPSTAHRPHSHHFTGPLFSPSPLSSTVSGLVPATLFRQPDGTMRRVSMRRSRPSLRSSLFVPSDELDDAFLERHYGHEGRGTVAELYRDEDRDGETQAGETRKGFRGRARSLSNTLGELLGTARRKLGNANGGSEQQHEGNSSNGVERSRHVAEPSSETL